MFGAPQLPRDRSRSPPRGKGKGGGPNYGGDWFCPNCHDHQFAKNICCRNCGTARPDDPSMCGPPDAATFLKNHIIDDAVLLRFLNLTADQQLIVIKRGTLSGARDPSAVLSSRITMVLQGTMTAENPNPRRNPAAQPNAAAPMMQMMMQMMGQMNGQIPGQIQGGKGGTIVPRSGDWYCQQCGDHQFAKNALCRSCGAARPTDGTECIPPSPEKFIAMHPALEEHAIAKFRSLDPTLQAIVIKRGSLIGSRDSSNPTAVLLGRLKTVQQQALTGMPMGGKGAAAPQQGGIDQTQMMQQMMMQMMQQAAQQQQPQQQLDGMQQMQQPLQQMQMGGMQQTMQPQQPQLGTTMVGGTNEMITMMQQQQQQQPQYQQLHEMQQMQQPLQHIQMGGMQQMMQPQQPQLGATMVGGTNDMMAMMQQQQQVQTGQAQLGQPQLGFSGMPHML